MSSRQILRTRLKRIGESTFDSCFDVVTSRNVNHVFTWPVAWLARGTGSRSPGRCNPRLPLRLGEAYGDLLAETHHRLHQQERLLRELREPTVVTHACMLQSEIEITRRFFVDERSNPELLSESSQLSHRRCALVQVHEVNLHS